MKVMRILKQIPLPFFSPPGDKDRDSHGQKPGPRGESMAADFLQKQGYTIVAKNYRQRMGEIDIVAEEGDCLVFVEVKTRKNDQYGNPFEAVDIRKQRKLSRLALGYISRHGGEDRNARFDVVAVYLDRDSGSRVEHLKNAFDFRE